MIGWYKHVLFVVLMAVCGHCYGNKLRVCVVDGRGSFKRAPKYCPVLDQPDSKVECVVGVDRLDCLRRISKGKADFSIFTPEDLVTASNSEIDVLITNQLRFTESKYEYEIVAVVNDDSRINSPHDLNDAKYCHPGYGYETDWTNILANFLEATVVPHECDYRLTLTENRIRSSSKFFRKACKAGPWVNDASLDATLKRKYTNLCALCDVPPLCSTNDKYWGRRGPLFCLTDGVGDISWARLDDVQNHFAATSLGINPVGFSYLCRDGTNIPVNSTRAPCVWVAKPWPVIAARKKRAAEVQQFFATIDLNNAQGWKRALLSLIQNFRQNITPMDPIQPIESYMLSAPGFLSANSFSGCHPPRTIRMCTTSILANAKCAWMREAAAVYGIEPDLDCIKADNVTHCMDAISLGVADVVLVEPDLVHHAKKNYGMQTLLYETTKDEHKYLTIAVLRNKPSTTHLKTFADLKGARACFPSYDGVAWNSILMQFYSEAMADIPCPLEMSFSNYFSSIMAPNLPKSLKHKMPKGQFNIEQFSGDYGVLRCLSQGLGDVGFLSVNSFREFFTDPREASAGISKDDFYVLCDKSQDTSCHYSWATVGQLMTSANKTSVWLEDTTDVFLQLDNLFGKFYKSVTVPFTMFGVFDSKSDVLFHDDTIKLKLEPTMGRWSKLDEKQEYNAILDALDKLECSSAAEHSITGIFLSVFMLFIVFTF